MPRPSGGSGSSRATVTWPTRTPRTSVIAFAAPGSRRPMRSPCSRSVNPLMRASLTRGREQRCRVAAMALSIPLVWADDHQLHEPSAEIWVGVRTPAAELPARAEAIRATLLEAGAELVAAAPHDDAAVEAVHDSALLEFLASAWA